VRSRSSLTSAAVISAMLAYLWKIWKKVKLFKIRMLPSVRPEQALSKGVHW
jgi:hypothetical protein